MLRFGGYHRDSVLKASVIRRQDTSILLSQDSQSGRERSQTATYERPSVTDLALDQSGQILVAQPSGRAHPIEPSVGIWEDEEVPHQAAACSSEDARETPRYEFTGCGYTKLVF